MVRGLQSLHNVLRRKNHAWFVTNPGCYNKINPQPSIIFSAHHCTSMGGYFTWMTNECYFIHMRPVLQLGTFTGTVNQLTSRNNLNYAGWEVFQVCAPTTSNIYDWRLCNGWGIRRCIFREKMGNSGSVCCRKKYTICRGSGISVLLLSHDGVVVWGAGDGWR